MKPSIVQVGAFAVFPVAILLQFTLIEVSYLGIAFVSVLLLDGWLGWRQRDISIERLVHTTIPIQRSSTVHLLIEHRHMRNIRVRVIDHASLSTLSHDRVLNLSVKPNERIRASYTIRPMQRGVLEPDVTHVAIASPLALWVFTRSVPNRSHIKVYPDFEAISKYLELASDARTTQLGIRLRPQRGSGLEFKQLREYLVGDLPNQVDWNATAKRRKLISREYQEERNQNLMIVLDTGRRMSEKYDEVNHFDYALNALILLAYVALRQGDTVSIMSYGYMSRWIPPQSGVGGINTILNGTFDLESGPVVADVQTSVVEVMKRQRKRSLVVWMTNVREVDSELPVLLKLLCRKHVVVLASLREKILDEVKRIEIAEFEDALLVAEAANYENARHNYLRQCAGQCHVLFEALPQEVLVRLVNAYWLIKRSGAL